MASPCANDNLVPRTMPEIDAKQAAVFVACVASATMVGATEICIPLRLAQSIAGQVRLQLGGLIDG